MHHTLVVLISAFLLEAIVGYPVWLSTHIHHPVVWIEAAITLLEKKFNHLEWPEIVRWLTGLLTITFLLAITYAITSLIRSHGYALPLYIVLVASLLGSRKTYEGIREMNEPDTYGTAIEILSQRFSDNVVAPLFWALMFGLPGIACYHVINVTSKELRDDAFGWTATKLNDIANWIPARISGFLIALAAHSLNALRCIALYATCHTSPNAGWPEAAMAGALEIQLGNPPVGDGTMQITNAHLKEALQIYLNACGLIGLMLLIAILRI